MLVPTWILPFLVVLFSAAIASIALLYRRVSAQETRLSVTETQIGPYWAVIQKVLSEKLTHHGHPEADELMKKLNEGKLTPSETIQLKQLMVERSHDFSHEINAAERETAIHFIWIMDQVILETQAMSKTGHTGN